MVRDNQIGRVFLKFPNKILAGLDSFGVEAQSPLAQRTIDHQQVRGVVFQRENSQIFVHPLIRVFVCPFIVEPMNYPASEK